MIHDLHHIGDVHPAPVAHDLDELHRRAARLHGAQDKRADGAGGEVQVDMEQELARRRGEAPRPYRGDRSGKVGRQVHVVDAVVQVEARIVAVVGEIGRRRHVLAEETQDGSECVGRNEVPGNPIAGGEPLHEADADRPAGPVGSGHQGFGIRGAGARRLFDEHRQAVRQGIQCHGDMRFRADGDADRINAAGAQQVAVIGVSPRHAVALGDVLGPRRVAVAYGRQPDRQAGELRQQHGAGMAAASDPTDVQGHGAASARIDRMVLAAAFRSADSSRSGGRHWASGTPMRSSERRNGSSEIGPA